MRRRRRRAVLAVVLTGVLVLLAGSMAARGDDPDVADGSETAGAPDVADGSQAAGAPDVADGSEAAGALDVAADVAAPGAPGASEGPSGPDVLVFGDSLSEQATPEMEQLLLDVGAEDGRVVSRHGARVRDAVAWVTGRTADQRNPKVIVLELGTNDAALDPQTFEQQWPEITDAIAEVLRASSDAGCIVWVAPELSGHMVQSRWIAGHIRETAPDVQILDWPKISDLVPHLYTGDGVHHTEGGQQRFAEAIIHEGVMGLCGLVP